MPKLQTHQPNGENVGLASLNGGLSETAESSNKMFNRQAKYENSSLNQSKDVLDLSLPNRSRSSSIDVLTKLGSGLSNMV